MRLRSDLSRCNKVIWYGGRGQRGGNKDGFYHDEVPRGLIGKVGGSSEKAGGKSKYYRNENGIRRGVGIAALHNIFGYYHRRDRGGIDISAHKMIFAKLIIMFFGALALLGWEMGFTQVTNWHSDWVTMKGVTAAGFVISGLMMMFLDSCRNHRNRIAQVVVSSLSFWLIFLMILSFFEPFSHKFDMKQYTVAPQMPSLATIACFIAVGVVGIAAIFNTQRYYRYCLWVSIMIAVIAVMAVLGYSVNVSSLYWYCPEISTGMALPTAISFMVVSFVIHDQHLSNKRMT